jgi:hypothetical protein
MKHVGRHGDKKVVVLYRTVPDEDHMCLVSYSDTLPRIYHDGVMKVLESKQGQDAGELADVLHRHLLPDGTNILQSIHKTGLIKKVPSSQVIMTPDPRNSVRLDELNKILKEMSQGQDAVRRMAELDAQAGMRDPQKSDKIPASMRSADALSDSAIAQNLRSQAERMQSEANSLLAESQRLMTEADQMSSNASEQVNQVQVARKAKKDATATAPVRRRRRPVAG